MGELIRPWLPTRIGGRRVGSSPRQDFRGSRCLVSQVGVRASEQAIKKTGQVQRSLAFCRGLVLPFAAYCLSGEWNGSRSPQSRQSLVSELARLSGPLGHRQAAEHLGPAPGASVRLTIAAYGRLPLCVPRALPELRVHRLL